MTAAEVTDELEWEEPADLKLRTHLGLRPIVYRVADGTADPRPCPSWCWVGQSNGEYEHEVEWDHPMSATHNMEGRASIASSQYRGARHSASGSQPAVVTTATIEPRLQQRGQGQPLVRIALCYTSAAGKAEYDDCRLALSIDEAHELSVVLNHLVEVANSG